MRSGECGLCYNAFVVSSWLIHLPIALLVLSVGLDVFGLTRRQAAAQRAALPLLALGLLGSLVSVIIGVRAVQEGRDPVVALHQIWAIATLVVFGGLFGLRWAARDGWSPSLKGMYFALAITGLLALTIAGLYGTELITSFGD